MRYYFTYSIIAITFFAGNWKHSVNVKKSNLVFKDTIGISKVKCDCELPGNRLLHFESMAEIKWYKKAKQFSNCTYQGLTARFIPNLAKINFIKSLFEHSTDTSLVCINTKWYINKNKIDSLPVKNYTISVEALYHLNIFCFYTGPSTFSYFPSPILYDTLLKKEINTDPNAIKEVYKIYYQWFKENLNTGFKNYRFPLLNTRYKWYGADTSNRIYLQLPNHW
jgi:hypothetical protein